MSTRKKPPAPAPAEEDVVALNDDADVEDEDEDLDDEGDPVEVAPAAPVTPPVVEPKAARERKPPKPKEPKEAPMPEEKISDDAWYIKYDNKVNEYRDEWPRATVRIERQRPLPMVDQGTISGADAMTSEQLLEFIKKNHWDGNDSEWRINVRNYTNGHYMLQTKIRIDADLMQQQRYRLKQQQGVDDIRRRASMGHVEEDDRDRRDRERERERDNGDGRRDRDGAAQQPPQQPPPQQPWPGYQPQMMQPPMQGFQPQMQPPMQGFQPQMQQPPPFQQMQPQQFQQPFHQQAFGQPGQPAFGFPGAMGYPPPPPAHPAAEAQQSAPAPAPAPPPPPPPPPPPAPEPVHARDYGSRFAEPRRRERFFDELPEEEEPMHPPPRFYQHQQPPPYWGMPPYQQQPPPLPPPPPPAAAPSTVESKDDRIHRLEREIAESRQAVREMQFESRHQAERMQQIMQDMRDTIREERRSDAQAAHHAQAVAVPSAPAMHPPPSSVPEGFIVMFDEHSPTGYVTIAQSSLEAFYAAQRQAPAPAAPAAQPAAKEQSRSAPAAAAPAFVGGGAPDYPAPPPYQDPRAYQQPPPHYPQQPYAPQYQQHLPPQYQQQQPPPQYQQQQPPPQYQAYPQAPQSLGGVPPEAFQQQQPPGQQYPSQPQPMYQTPQPIYPTYPTQGAAPAPAPQAVSPAATQGPAAAAPVDPVEAAIKSYNESKNTLSRLRTAFAPDEDDDAGKDSGEAASAATSPEATAIVAKPEPFHDTGFWKFPLDKDGKPLTGFKDGLSTIGVNMDKLPIIGNMFLQGASKMLDLVDQRGAKFREETELLERQARAKAVLAQLPPKQQQQAAPAPAAPKPTFSGFPAIDEIPRPPKNN